MDQITEVPRRSLFADSLQIVKRVFDLANPLKGSEKVGTSSTVFDLDPITRRRFLGHLGIWGIMLTAPILFKDLDKKTQPKKRTLTVAAPTSDTPLASETVKIPDSLDSLEDRLLKNFSAEEKAQADKEIVEQIKLYQEQPGHEKKAERVLDWETTTIKPIVDLDVPLEDQKFWSEFMSAIAYVESGGKAGAISEADIIGVAQISKATAEATAKKHGILTFDLKKGWDSLRLSRFHFQDLMERFSADISLLGYYGGQPFTDQKIQESLRLKGALSNQQMKSLIDQYGVNIENLGSKDGQEYFKKFVAALRILKEARSTL